jgi:hypothetical protein
MIALMHKRVFIVASIALLAAACERAPPPGPPRQIALHIKSGGIVEFEGGILTVTELEKRLSELEAHEKNVVINPHIDREVIFDDMKGWMAVLDKSKLNIGVLGGTR